MSWDAVSPLDGRYRPITARLTGFLGVWPMDQARVRLEIRWLQHLAAEGAIPQEIRTDGLQPLASGEWFRPIDSASISLLSRTTAHDMVALTTWLRGRLQQDEVTRDVARWVHFGLTSEDVENVVYAQALSDVTQGIVVPSGRLVLETIQELMTRCGDAPMLGRTHGQVAAPTTMRKELEVSLEQIAGVLAPIAMHRFTAKVNGAVGTHGAMMAALPELDWPRICKHFIRKEYPELKVETSPTTQILPYQNWLSFFQHLHLLNSTMLNLSQDLWRYASDGWLVQEAIPGEAGSSAMPHKVNPIALESAEGNLGLANALIEYFIRKLPVSRLQRDLSDSTVRRSFGSALGYCLVAYHSLTKGIRLLRPDPSRMRDDLFDHWECLTDAALAILISGGHPDPYGTVKHLRGQQGSQGMPGYAWKSWCWDVTPDPLLRLRLLALEPDAHLGSAARPIKEDSDARDR